MDQHRFSALTRSVWSRTPRRDVVRGLASAGIGLGAPWLSESAEAKKKRKSKKKKANKKSKKQIQPLAPLVFNQYGCIDVGQPCRGDSALCCSGVCQGAAPSAEDRLDASRCVAHNTGICTASSDLCSTGTAVLCKANNARCGCVLTTGKAGFCGDFNGVTGEDSYCRVCTRDTDCQEEFGPGAACLVYGEICSEFCPTTGGTACAPPCV